MNIKKCTWVRKFCVTAFAVAMAVTLLPAQAGSVKAAENQDGQEEPAKHEHKYENGKVRYEWDEGYYHCKASVTCTVENCNEKIEETADAIYNGEGADADGNIYYSLSATFENSLFEQQNKEIETLKGKVESSDLSFFSLDELIASEASEEEFSAVFNGSKSITYTLKSVEKEPAEAVKTAIDKLAENEGFTIAKYLDITLLKQVDSGDPTAITSLEQGFLILMNIPSNLQAVDSGKTREYTVLRYHDGLAEDLGAEVCNNEYESGERISFYTDGFSAYALAYKDVSNAPAPAPANNSSNTSNSSSTSVSSTASNTSAETTAAAQADAAQLTSPKTGDNLQPVALFAILLVSCTGLFGCLAMQKRRA